MQNYLDLLNRATVIRDETRDKHNTAVRVGSLLQDIVNWIYELHKNDSDQGPVVPSAPTGNCDCNLTEQLVAGHTIGGVTTGKVYPKGTSLRTIIIDMFYKEPPAPVYTSPTVSLSVTSEAEYNTKCSALSITITLNQNDGGSFANSGTLTIKRPDGSTFKSITVTISNGTATIPAFAATDLLNDIGNWTFSFSVGYAANANNTVSAGTASSGNKTLSVYTKMYYGRFATNNPGLSEADVKNLSTIKLTGNKTDTLSVTGGLSIVFVYPKNIFSLNFNSVTENGVSATYWSNDDDDLNIRKDAASINGLSYYAKGRKAEAEFGTVSANITLTRI